MIFSDKCVMVSMHGEDEPECLTASQTTPCKTLSYAIAAGHDVICMNGTFQNISEDIEITNNKTGGRAITVLCISCVIDDSNVTFHNYLGQMPHVSFFNFTIMNSKMQLQNIHVDFKEAMIEQVMIQDYENAPNQIHFEQSSLTCFDMQTCGLLLLHSSIVKCVIRQSHLNHFKLDLSTQDLMLVIKDTIMVQPDIHVTVHSPAFLRVPSLIQFHNLTVSTQSNTNDTGSSSFKGKKSIENLLFSSGIVLHLTNPYLDINRCHFFQTHLEIVASNVEFDQAYFWTVIADTTFRNSYHSGDGGALTISSAAWHSGILISSCIFTNNTVVKSTGASKGHGGGMSVRSDSLELHITNSTFFTNRADNAGLHLYTSEGITVSLSNSTFYSTVDPLHPIQDVLVFIAGRFTTQNQSHFQVTNFQPESYVGLISLFYVANVNDLNIAITCPKWYGHNPQYASRSTENNQLTDVRYDCAPCSDNYYTTSSAERILAYGSSGNTSIAKAEGMDQSSHICIKCPYGALCTGNNIKPGPNYWGYWHKSELVFQQCPVGYCCSGSDSGTCKVHDYCAGNKTGTLCGACQEDFSVSILSGVCIPNSQCGDDHWFWLVVLIATMVYAFWYTLKDDIFALFFRSTTFLKHIFNCSNVRKNTSLSNRAKSQESVTDSSFDIEIFAKDNNEAAKNKKETSPSDDDVDKGYFGIVTYYVQMAAVIKIQIEFSDIDQSEPFLDIIVNYIDRFLNLQLTNISQFDICPIVGLTTVGRHLYNLFFLLGIYASWVGVFAVTIIIVTIMHKVGSIKSVVDTFNLFRLRLVRGLIEIIKYTYAGFCGIIFMSLVCAKVGHKYVWWYDGTNVCLENWQ